ncbi:cytochrome P450 [Sphaerosporella brunnea]|uniref:Cytochrome P450 n=1 Tax=Sphaerosporella brunnea TaxID=1250544 RepID=A0A5J5EKQ0_9PEZI|nr:cytochrome P450 [Sphaerosporella brunnea]
MLLAAALANPLFYPAALVVAAAGWVVYQRVFSPYAGIPGPFWASVTRFWYLRRVIAEDIHRCTKSLHQRYGPIVRIAPDEVSISDPAAMKQIYAVTGGFTKTDFYTAQTRISVSPRNDLVTERDEAVHAVRRRLVNRMFTMSSIMESEAHINRVTEAFFQALSEHATNSKTLDMAQWLRMYTMDIIGELFFGRMFGFIQERKDIGGYMAAIDAVAPHGMRVGVMSSWMRPFQMLLIPFSSQFLPGIRGFKALAAESKRYVEERVGMKTERRDMLGALLQIAEEHNPEFDLRDVHMEAYVAIFAGAETTATALRSTVYHLSRTPHARAKLQAEIDSAHRRGKLSPMITYGEAVELPYLDAVLKEAMRVQPPIAFTLPRHVPAGGRTICGRFSPAGSRVGISPYVLHYQKSVFGEDAEDFSPERWLGPDAARMDRYMFQFGYGSRSCLGKNLALAELYKLVPQIYRAFDVRLVDPTKEWKEQGSFFWKHSEIEVLLVKREVQ